MNFNYHQILLLKNRLNMPDVLISFSEGCVGIVLHEAVNSLLHLLMLSVNQETSKHNILPSIPHKIHTLEFIFD